MSTVQLNNLEFQIDTLLQHMEKLQAENQSLRNQLAQTHREKIRLREKNQKAAIKVKRIVSQLKEELA